MVDNGIKSCLMFGSFEWKSQKSINNNITYVSKSQSLNTKFPSYIKKLQTAAGGVESDKPPVRGRKRSLDDYSDRHQRRLKKERTKSCSQALSWLEKEGVKPLKVCCLT